MLAIALAAGSAVYAARHFAIKTDVTYLFPSDLPWTQRAFQYMKAFPQPDILVVVDAPTPELVEQAVTELAQALRNLNHIRAAHQPESGSFFEQNGMLYLPTGELARLTDGLVAADPIIKTLVSDPSLRGTLRALSLGLMAHRLRKSPSVLRWLGRTNLHLNSQCSLALRHARSLACFPVSARRIGSPPLSGSLEPLVSDDVQHYPWPNCSTSADHRTPDPVGI